MSVVGAPAPSAIELAGGMCLMTRKVGILAAVMTTLVLTASLAFAGNAHFVGTPQISISGNTITVSGKVAGLGAIPDVNVAFTADAQCVNPGHQKPQAGNKQSFGADGNVPVQNGKALFSLSATATFQPDCTPPMTVSWSNVQITVTDPTTGEVLATYP
jgi:hypothetical protein